MGWYGMARHEVPDTFEGTGWSRIGRGCSALRWKAEGSDDRDSLLADLDEDLARRSRTRSCVFSAHRGRARAF